VHVDVDAQRSREAASLHRACDLFHVETVLLRRLFVLFFIELDTMRVEVLSA
jgi:hypothetical protein